MRDLIGERLSLVLRQKGEHRCVHRPRCDRADADEPCREVAGDRQRHRDDAAFGRRVRDLPDLTVVRRDARGVDDDAALAVDRLLLHHLRGGQARHVERADQVDPNHFAEHVERVRSVLVDGPLRPADPRAAHRDVKTAEFVDSRLHGPLHVGFSRHVGRRKPNGVAQLLGDRFARRVSQVGDHDARTAGDQRFNRCPAQPGRPAGHQRSFVFKLHVRASLWTAWSAGRA